MDESLGGIIMGHALRATETGRLHPMPRKEPNRSSWYHDWRGKSVWSTIHAAMVVSGVALSWSLWHLSLHLLR